tara:strand:+ start:115 stop:417 length:303 start_codon:yes stop_codon:yes gene_type:complete
MTNKKIQNNNTQKLFNICVELFPFLSEGEKNKRIFKRLQILELITDNPNFCNRALELHEKTNQKDLLASQRFNKLTIFSTSLAHDLKGLSANDKHFLPRI